MTMVMQIGCFRWAMMSIKTAPALLEIFHHPASFYPLCTPGRVIAAMSHKTRYP